MTRRPQIPVIKCLPRPDLSGGMMFWCSFCRRWHLHGLGNGHRAAHCHREASPFSKTGYTLKMMSKAELKEAKKAITNYLRTPQ